jgi:hypothetical protein
MALLACPPWQPHLFCPFPYTQPDIFPRVTAATGDIYRSSLPDLTKALRTWLSLQGRKTGEGQVGRQKDADSCGLVWQAWPCTRTGEVNLN